MRTPRPMLPLLLWLVAIQSVFAFDEDSSFTIPYPSRDFTKIPEAVAQAKQSSFADYPEIVRCAAKKDSRALVRLFYVDSKTQWDAAGSELQILSCAKCSLFGETTILPRLLLGSLLKFRRACPATLECSRRMCTSRSFFRAP